jgi:phosphate transport system substrate-binding protein
MPFTTGPQPRNKMQPMARKSQVMHRTTRLMTSLAACGALAFGAAACGDDGGDGGDSASTGEQSRQLSGSISGAGASSQDAAKEAWIAGFQQQNPEVTVSYDPVGSGGGREQFAAGGVAFAGSDSALADEELAAAQKRCGGPDKLIQMPIYISPIAIAYNLEGVEDLQLSPDTLARVLKGEIDTWDDPAIAKDNPDADLPGDRITVVHRSDESGTTENLQEYLAEVAPDVWDFEVDGNWPAKGGEAAQGTSGVVDAIKAGKGTIGYADASQARDLGVAKIKVGEEYTEPTPEAAAAVVEASKQTKGGGRFVFTYDLARDTTEAGTYPIVLMSYEIACTTYDKPGEGEVVKGFLEYELSPEGQDAAAENAGSAPLSDALRQRFQPAVDAIGGGA